MDTKMIAGAVVGAVVLAGASFYGGMHYAGQSRAARFGQTGANGQFTRGAGGAGRFAGGTGNFVTGTILSSDATSITVQLGGPSASSTNNGQTGSKIVLINGSTQISKFVAGSESDLQSGQMVTVQGTQNSDGSITAQMIQVRPAGMGPRLGN